LDLLWHTTWRKAEDCCIGTRLLLDEKDYICSLVNHKLLFFVV